MDTDRLIEIDDTIDRFLRGQMSPEEEASFKSDLENDANLKARAISQAMMVRSMQNLKATTSATRNPTAATTVTPKWRIGIWSAAAIIVLIICSVPCIKLYQSTQLADNYLAMHEVPYTPSRGGDSLTQVELNTVFESVKSHKDLNRSIEKLENIRKQINEDKICNYGYYEYEVTWYLSLAYLEKGKRRKAAQLLQDFIESHPNEPRLGDMKELLNRVKDI